MDEQERGEPNRAQAPEPSNGTAGDVASATKEPFGARLARLLSEATMTQAQLAVAASIDPSQVSRMIANRRAPSSTDLDGICEALRIGVAELVVGTTAEAVIERTAKLVPVEQHNEALAVIASLRRQLTEAQRQLEAARQSEAERVQELAAARAEAARKAADVARREADVAQELASVRAEAARRETEHVAVTRALDSERARRIEAQTRFNDLLERAKELQRAYRVSRGLLQRAAAENDRLAAELAGLQRQNRAAQRNGALMGAAATAGLAGLFSLLARTGADDDGGDLDGDEEEFDDDE